MGDALTNDSPPGVLWSRVNAAEALPGVMTPVTWSFYGETMEVSLRRGFADLGIIPASATSYPPTMDGRMVGIFHGRLTVSVDDVRRIMSGLPGVSGEEIERDMLGSARPGIPDTSYPHRLPFVLVKAPARFARSAGDARRSREDNVAWWQRSVGPDGPRAGVDARQLLRESLRRFGAACRLQAQNRMFFGASAAQLTAVAEAAGEPESASSLLAGAAGTEESQVADDLYELAHGRLELDAFRARHGFHTTSAGELSARSWREDARPLSQLLGVLRDAESPAVRRARAATEAERVTTRVLARLPRHRRLGAQLLLRMAPATARTLECSKMSFLLTNDCGRAAVRAVGDELVAADRLDDAEDAFHLFSQELLAPGSADLRALVTERRRLRRDALAVELPDTWEGTPQPTPVPDSAAVRDAVTTLTGLGASSGVVQGRVLVVRDAADDVEIEPGDVLVCPTTDPSWLALMTVAAALVIDIGATASHGAIVARELGVPCVIGTRTGSTELRTGDIVRVDGSSGVVTVLATEG